MAIPDLSIYSAAQVQELKDAVFAERMRRLSGQQVTNGSKNGKSYGLTVMSDAELSALESALSNKLGRRNNRARMDFSRRSYG